jgi:hypothetical protein
MAEASKQSKKELPVLVLPNPHRIDGSVDAMLESGIAERYLTISLVKTSEKDVSKGQPVLSHTPSKDDPKVQVSSWNSGLGHLTRFLMAGINAWAGGMGLSGDGSVMYVDKHADLVFKTVPALKDYDIYLVPNGRSGCSKYRLSVSELVGEIRKRAKAIAYSVEAFGIAQGKERTKKAEDVPEITAIL